MSYRLRLLGAVLAVVLAGPALTCAQEKGIWEEGLQEGDLIFLETKGPLSEFLKVATGSRLTHVGIMRPTGGGPYVLDSTPEHGVFEVPFEEFIERGVGRNYAVYRFDGLEYSPDVSHPAIAVAYRDYYLLPYDPFYRSDRTAFYDSELVRVAFAHAGVELGTSLHLRDLGVDTVEGRAVFFGNWRNHPDCRAANLDAEACWNLIQDQNVVTPASIAGDPKLKLVYSTFDAEARD